MFFRDEFCTYLNTEIPMYQSPKTKFIQYDVGIR